MNTQDAADSQLFAQTGEGRDWVWQYSTQKHKNATWTERNATTHNLIARRVKGRTSDNQYTIINFKRVWKRVTREECYCLTAAGAVGWGARPRDVTTSTIEIHNITKYGNGLQRPSNTISIQRATPLALFWLSRMAGPTQVHYNDGHIYDIMAINRDSDRARVYTFVTN